MAVMKRDGVRAATTRRICEEAGVAQGAFHYCFRSKQELFVLLMERDAEAPVQDVRDEITPSMSPRECIALLMDRYWQQVEKDPGEQLVLAELSVLALRDSALSDYSSIEHRVYLAATLQHLRHAAERTGMTYSIPIEELAEVTTSAMLGVSSVWLATRDSVAARRNLDILAEMVAAYAITP
ncbi:TetR/AcrR family transcriptional regulator [Microbacterium amylolyticum]|uniref:TetR/AcrR family transcriptional regulator n=1 Tax=Microbacterium amylolyticum TaxID=936337 RepID=UPI00247A4B46|nr:TetR/AcrR family transcriptional regulator [Microbacterium amylolyticum]